MGKSKNNWSKIPEELKTLFWVFVGTAIVIFIIASLGIFGYVQSSDIFGFMSGLLAGILGILIGFSLDKVSDHEKERKTKADFLKLIHEELVEIRKLTPPDIMSTGQIYILYTDVWDSMVSSGDLCLLESDQVLKLSRLYKHIKATTFEAEWFRRGWEEYQSIPDSEKDWKENYVGKKLNTLGAAQIKRLKDLRHEIDLIMDEQWWG